MLTNPEPLVRLLLDGPGHPACFENRKGEV
jgi:hypothetical protein